VTSTAPYLIIIALFIRGITLKGAGVGVYHFLGKPDMTKLLKRETWIAALVQTCYAMEVGYGGILTMASYNRRSNNCYRDSWIVVLGIIVMSIFGGLAVFSTLGYLSHELRKPIDEVVTSGLSLAFVAYPEAMAKMPWPTLWGLMFFSMLFFLGVSSQAGYRHLYDDVVEMFGEPRGTWLSLLGPHSCIWMISWRVITPVISALVFTFTLLREPLKIDIGATEYVFPAWAT
ncbi:Sodium:neurotransmitter symporter family protein, partial [Teladorsagia circumcincta]